MGNYCDQSEPLNDYDPHNYIDTPEDDLDLNPLNYPNYGLYVSSCELEAVRKDIVTMNIEEQATYSDAITRRYALNPHFIKMQLRLNAIAKDIDKMPRNTTSIGNAAFMALYNPSEWTTIYNDTIRYF